MPQKLDNRKMDRILQVLAYDFAEAKRYSFIWECVKERRGYGTSTKHIGTKKTLNVYLKRLEEHGRIVRNKKSRKKVFYALPEKEQKIWDNLKQEYKAVMQKRFEDYEKQAWNTVKGVKEGDIPKEKIEGVVLNAWLFYVRSSTEAFDLLVDAKQAVSFVSYALLNDWVMSPFMLSAKVVEACHNKHPTETIEALKKLRNMFQKMPSV